VGGFVVVKPRVDICAMMMTVRIIYVIRTGGNCCVVLYVIRFNAWVSLLGLVSSRTCATTVSTRVSLIICG